MRLKNYELVRECRNNMKKYSIICTLILLTVFNEWMGNAEHMKEEIAYRMSQKEL
jgi:hypothetical protein